MDFNCDKCDGTRNEDNDCRQLDRGVTVDKTEYLHTRNPASTLKPPGAHRTDFLELIGSPFGIARALRTPAPPGDIER